MVPSSSQPPSPCDRWRDSREIWVRKLPVSDLHLPSEIPSRSEPTSSVWSWRDCCLQLLLHTDSATAQPNSIHLPQELGAAPARRSSHSNWHAHQMMMPRARAVAPWIQHPASLCLISRWSRNSRKTSKLIDKLQHRSSRVVLHRKASYLRWRFLLLFLHPKEGDRTLDWIKLANSRSCNGREKNRIRNPIFFGRRMKEFPIAGGRREGVRAWAWGNAHVLFNERIVFLPMCVRTWWWGWKKERRSQWRAASEWIFPGFWVRPQVVVYFSVSSASNPKPSR